LGAFKQHSVTKQDLTPSHINKVVII